jgi:hypothetical protein
LIKLFRLIIKLLGYNFEGSGGDFIDGGIAFSSPV